MRKTCSLPENYKFGSLELLLEYKDYINMSIDEYETISFIDLKEFSKIECVTQMNVLRPTVQRIYM